MSVAHIFLNGSTEALCDGQVCGFDRFDKPLYRRAKRRESVAVDDESVMCAECLEVSRWRWRVKGSRKAAMLY